MENKLLINISNASQLFSLVKSYEKNQNELNIIMQNENTHEIIKNILFEKNRSEEEIYLLKIFLRNLTKFMKLISREDTGEIDYILTKVSNDIELEIHKKNNFIMKIGDIGNNFYIILKGKVAVIITKIFDVIMTKKEYINHLKLLKYFEENYLFNNTLVNNYEILPIESSEIENEKLNVKNLEYDNLKDYFSLINADNYQDEEKINKIIGLNNFEIDKILNPNRKSKTKYYYLKITGLFKVVELNEGNSFGEMALSNKDFKRTASIYTLEDSFFGTLNYREYKMSLKSYLDEYKNLSISLVFENTLFKNIGKTFFINKFWNYFIVRNLKKGEYIFKNNFRRDEIYFIYKGEIKIISPKLTYNKIIQYLNEFCPCLNLNSKLLDIKKESDIILTYVKTGEIIGMNDLLFHKKFFVDGIIESNNAIVFAIDYHFMNEFLNTYSNVRFNWNIIEKKKKNIMISRLESIKRTYESDIIELTRREDIDKKYDCGQKVTNFFENMGNIFKPGENNMLKIKTIQEKFDLNPIDKHLYINKSNKFIFKKNKNHFSNNYNTIDDYNKSYNTITIDYDRNLKKKILPIITLHNSFIKEKINQSSKKNINEINYLDNINNNSNSKDKNNITILGRLFKRKKNNNIKILKKNINLKGISYEKFLKKDDLSFSDSKEIESKKFLNSLSASKNQISNVAIKEYNSKKILNQLYFYDNNVNNLMKKNLGISFAKSMSYNNQKNNIKNENKRKIRPPFSYIRMGMTLKNIKHNQ